jgi:hypothetical protein
MMLSPKFINLRFPWLAGSLQGRQVPKRPHHLSGGHFTRLGQSAPEGGGKDGCATNGAVRVWGMLHLIKQRLPLSFLLVLVFELRPFVATTIAASVRFQGLLT